MDLPSWQPRSPRSVCWGPSCQFRGSGARVSSKLPFKPTKQKADALWPATNARAPSLGFTPPFPSPNFHGAPAPPRPPPPHTPHTPHPPTHPPTPVQVVEVDVVHSKECQAALHSLPAGQPGATPRVTRCSRGGGGASSTCWAHPAAACCTCSPAVLAAAVVYDLAVPHKDAPLGGDG
jgi:hypothetical protein